MKVIGLTGGVGSGKSLAAQILKEECRAELLIADDLGHLAMEPGTEGYRQIIERFGRQILNQDGLVDHEALSLVIFRDEQARTDLNGIIHPAVLEYIKKYIQERKSLDGMIILESAILFETGCDRFCDQIWYVHVSDEIRRERLADNRGYTIEKTESIMSKQLSVQEFYSRCDVVVENDGTKEDLTEQIRARLPVKF
ncbi:MAG: dephospho-CoA kinase [Lachnospiraceae bacterium]|nr:dephospho-CoA kinase [Lachnospiraceae bacterium]